jgi:CRP-like cAMP-binding protein
LIVILSGKVEVTQGCGPEQRETIVTHLPGQFAGELAQLSARPSLVDADALEPVQALVVRSDRLRDLLVHKAVGGKGFIRKPPKRVDYLLRYTRDNPPYRLQAPINRGIETPAQRYFQIGEPEARLE